MSMTNTTRVSTHKHTAMVSAEPSLCIPRVFSNITWMRVREEIEAYGLGIVDHVDMVSRENDRGECFQRVFIHFKEWSNTQHAQDERTKIMNGEMIQLTYDAPWFWKIGRNFATTKKTKRTDTRRPVLETNTVMDDGYTVIHPRRQGVQPQRIQHPRPMRMTNTPPRVRFQEQYNQDKQHVRPVKVSNTPTYSSVADTNPMVSQLMKEMRLLKITVERQAGQIDTLKKELKEGKYTMDIDTDTETEKSVSPPIPECLSKMLITTGESNWCDIVEQEGETDRLQSDEDEQRQHEEEDLTHNGRVYKTEELDNYDDI